MSADASSQGVSKLKELLFDGEAEHLADLARRLDAIGNSQEELRAALTERRAYEEGARAELARRLDAVHDRVGSDERFSSSVATVLDSALVRAERDNHGALRAALAPVMVPTVKTEIINSKDSLVEALYPMTGRMVKAYVRSAMKDLINQVNRRLESNALMLRIKSLTTGRSMAELALAESQRIEVEELLLIRRGTGELIARWPEKPGPDNHDHVLGGVLTAINSFATEALQSKESALRQIDLGESQVYLRGSPNHLLAAKCKGTAGASIEQIIDDEFLRTVGELHGGDERVSKVANSGLGTLGSKLDQRISQQYELFDRPALGISPATLLVALIGLPLLAWFAWSTYTTYETNRVRETARNIIATSSEIAGYPTTITVGPRGRELTISGLAPNTDAAQTVLSRLGSALPETAIESHISVVPQGTRDTTKDIVELRERITKLNREIPRRAALRALFNADRAFADAAIHLDRLAALAATSENATTRRLLATSSEIDAPLKDATEAISSARAAMRSALPGEAEREKIAESLAQRASDLERAIDKLAQQSALVGVTSKPAADSSDVAAGDNAQPGYVIGAERLDLLAQRLQLITVALVQAELTRASIPKITTEAKPAPEPVPPAIVQNQSSARQQLRDFVEDNAVFFAEQIEYRNESQANATIDGLAKLIRETGAFVRIVGYTDERGSSTRNSTLSERRAERVRAALISRSVPPDNLVAIGRVSQFDISPATGSGSPNRRVEFEIGFKGEVGP